MRKSSSLWILEVKYTIRADFDMELKVITEPHFFPEEGNIINHLFENGMPCLHLRKPETSNAQIEVLLSEIRPDYFNRIMIHDHFELAEKYDLMGVHFTFRTRDEIKSSFKNRQKSCGCHSFSELNETVKFVDYAFLSPVYNSISKSGYNAAFSPDEIQRQLSYLSAYKIYALGGITPQKIPELRVMGFSGIGILGALWKNDYSVQQLNLFLKALQ